MNEPIHSRDPAPRGWQSYEIAAVIVCAVLLLWGLGASLSKARSGALDTDRAKERQQKLKDNRAQQKELDTFGVADAKVKRFRMPVGTAMDRAADAMKADPVAFRSNLLQRLPPPAKAKTKANDFE